MSQPISGTHPIDSARALPPASGAGPDWAEVHEQVQTQLAALENAVRQKLPGVRVDIGSTHGERFYLFSYRTFSLPGRGFDPVVAGMTFTPAPEGVLIEADVSGEQTGDDIASVPSRTAASSREGVLAAAVEAARNLCPFADAIAAALSDRRRMVD